MDKILLKGIYIEHYLVKSKVEEEILPEIVIKTDNNFWQELEKKCSNEYASQDNTETACWSCSLFFDCKPWGIPIFSSNEIVNNDKQIYELHNILLDSTTRTEKETMKFVGNFCSVCCAIRFLEETIELPLHCKQNYKNLLYHIFEKQTGKKVVYIPPAYPKYKMKIYSGKDGWSEEEFKEKNRLLEKQMII